MLSQVQLSKKSMDIKQIIACHQEFLNQELKSRIARTIVLAMRIYNVYCMHDTVGNLFIERFHFGAMEPYQFLPNCKFHG